MTEKIYVGHRFKCDKNGTNEFKIVASGRDKTKVKAETISKVQDYLDDELCYLLSPDSLSVILREMKQSVADADSYEYLPDDYNQTHYLIKVVDDFLG